jgi:hypothetical protein
MADALPLPAELPRTWRAEAEHLKPYAPAAAVAYELAAAQLEQALATANDESLTLEEAARESGFSRDHLRHLVSAGELPNAGRKGSPRVLRKHLPKKAARPGSGAYDPDADALALVSRRSP